MKSLGKLSFAITATTKGLQAAAKKSQSIIGGVAKSAVGLPGLLGAATGGAAVKGLLDVADSYSVMGSQLEFLAGNAEDAAFLQEDLYEISKQTGTSMKQNTAAYVKLTQAQDKTGLSSAENIKVIGGLNALMIKTGTSGDAASTAMYQLGQSLTKGKLDGDEYVSMSENASGVMVELAKQLGLTSGEMKQMSTNGELTSDLLGAAFLAIAESGDVAFEDLPATAAKGMNAVSLAFQKLWGEISTENGILGWIMTGLESLATDIEENSGLIKAWAEESWGKFLEIWPEIKTGLTLIGQGMVWLITKIKPTIEIIKVLVEWFMKAIEIAQKFSPLGLAARAAGGAYGAYQSGAGVWDTITAGASAAVDIPGQTTVINNNNLNLGKSQLADLNQQQSRQAAQL